MTGRRGTARTSIAAALVAANVAWPAVIVPAQAHRGGLDAQGCHRDRRAGGRHCHGAAERRAIPAQTTRAAAGGSFPSCRAAREAGAAPVRRGDPGYARIWTGTAMASAVSKVMVDER